MHSAVLAGLRSPVAGSLDAKAAAAALMVIVVVGKEWGTEPVADIEGVAFD